MNNSILFTGVRRDSLDGGKLPGVGGGLGPTVVKPELYFPQCYAPTAFNPAAAAAAAAGVGAGNGAGQFGSQTPLPQVPEFKTPNGLTAAQ